MLKQNLQQKLLQKLSPQQIQLMKLLQVPTAVLEQRIKEELESNPALEEGDDEYESPDEAESDESDFEDDFETTEEGIELESKNEDIDINEYLGNDDEPYYKTQSNNYSGDDEQREIPFSAGIGFHDMLISQVGLRQLTEKQQ